MSFHVSDNDLADPENLEEALNSVFEGRAMAAAVPAESESESGEGDLSEDQAPIASDESTPAPVEEAEDQEPATPSTFTVGDRVFDASQAEQLLGLYDWVDRMDPAFAEDIGRLASGQFDLIPRGQEQAPPPPPAPVDPLAEVDLDLVPPELVNLVKAQQAQIDEMNQHLLEVRDAASRANNFAANQTFEQAANIAMASFGERHQLAPEFLEEVARAASPNVRMFAGTSNDASQIFDQALEHTLWTTPQFRAKILADETGRAVDQQAALSQEIQEKVDRQAAVNSSSGSVPRSEPSVRNLNPQERQSAMVAEVANYLSQP